MNKINQFAEFLNKKLTPSANKINANVWVQTMRDSVLQLLPFIFLGSIFTMLGILNEYFPWVPPGYDLSGWTFGKIGLFVAFLVPFNYCEKKRMRKLRIVAGMTSIALFLMMITPQVTVEEYVGFGHSTLGAGGMICAMVGGVFTAVIFKLLNNFSFFKKNSAIPDFIREWFDLMVPICVVILVAWFLIFRLNLDIFAIIETIFSPLKNGYEMLPIYIIYALVIRMLYSIGISNWVLTGITTPICLAAIAANAEMVVNGTASPETLNLFTNETANMYILVGGMGTTLGLNFLMLRAKSQKMRVIGKASLVPSLFNINEPLVYGSIVWNPIMMIPFILNGAIVPTVTYIFTKVIAFAPIPTNVFNLWFCPPFLLSFLTTGAITAIILTLINVVIQTIVYYPFFKVYDNQEAEKEREEEKQKAK